MIDSLAAGLRECLRKPIVGEQLDLDGFFDQMLTSRIARRVSTCGRRAGRGGGLTEKKLGTTISTPRNRASGSGRATWRRAR